MLHGPPARALQRSVPSRSSSVWSKSAKLRSALTRRSSRIRTLAPEGVAHIVEVAFDANIAVDTELLAVGGLLVAYATGEPSPPVPFWELVFKNIRVFFLGSDDFPAEAKAAAARDLNAALEAKWPGFETIQTFALSAIAEAHESVESRKARGRVVVTP